MAQLLMPGSVVAMTDQAADRLLKLDSGDAALLYLHLLRWGTPDGLRWPEDRKQPGAGPAEGARPGPGRSVRRSGRPAVPRRPRPRSMGRRISPPPSATLPPPSQPWPTRWSGGWAKSSRPMI